MDRCTRRRSGALTSVALGAVATPAAARDDRQSIKFHYNGGKMAMFVLAKLAGFGAVSQPRPSPTGLEKMLEVAPFR